MYGSALIAGKIFKSHVGLHKPGDELPSSAQNWTNIEALISAGFVYPVVDERSYRKLPPHVFNAVVTRKEAEEKVRIAASQSVTETPADPVVQSHIKAHDDERRSHTQQRVLAEMMVAKQQKLRNEPIITEDSVTDRLPNRKIRVDGKKVEAARAAEERQSKYRNWSKPQLQDELAERGLPKSGNIPDLVQRLEMNDGEEQIEKAIHSPEDGTA